MTIASPRSKLYASLSARLYIFLASRFAEIFVLILRENLQTPLTKELTSSPRATLTLVSCLTTSRVQLYLKSTALSRLPFVTVVGYLAFIIQD